MTEAEFQHERKRYTYVWGGVRPIEKPVVYMMPDMFAQYMSLVDEGRYEFVMFARCYDVQLRPRLPHG